MAEIWRFIGEVRRRTMEVLVGEDGYEESLPDRIAHEARGALVVSRQGRVFAPPVIELEIHPEDVRALRDVIGTGDPTAYVRHRMGDAVRDVIFSDEFRVRLVETDRVRPGRPRCTTMASKLDLVPFLAGESEGLVAPSSRRLRLGPETEVTRELLSSIVPADMEISNKRHAVIAIISRRRVEIRPVPNRYTAVEGTPLTDREVLYYREGGYRLTFGSRRLLLFWAEEFRPVPPGGRL